MARGGGGVAAVMCSYNRANDFPMCASPLLQARHPCKIVKTCPKKKTIVVQSKLRSALGFSGYIVSDGGAVDFMVTRHKWAKNAAVASAAALNAGVDLDLGATYGQPTGLAAAFSAGAVSEATIDRAVKRVMLARVSLGEMDDTATRAADPLSKIGLGAIDAPQSRQLAHDMAVESIVLLKNVREGEG